MTTKLYLDRRGVSSGLCPVKISISSKGRTLYLPTNITVLAEQWDTKAERIVSHPQKAQLNNLLAKRKLTVDAALYDLQDEGKLHGCTIAEIKRILEYRINPVDNALFLPRLLDYADRQKCQTTKYTFLHTADKIRAFCKSADRLHFEDITPKWLESFNDWMAESAPSQNARNILLRDIRTVFNDAIDDEVTTYYPFRKFKIRAEPTKSRALTVEQCRKIFTANTEYSDFFALCFYLGGISWCDLCALTPENIVAGRIEYRRQKTGQLCSIGITPEAQTLLDKYAGKTHLVRIAENSIPQTYLHNMNESLKHIGSTYNPKTKKWDGTPVCNHLSQYWARYTVATLAAENGVGQDVIGAMLGHSTNTSVTAIYMRANRNKQVDDALRGVIDKVKG